MVVQMGGVSSVDGTVWRFHKVCGEAKNAKACPLLLPQFQVILSDPQRLMSLKLKLAATIDVGEHFVKATKFLVPLVFAFYEKLSAVSQFFQAPCFPNVRAIVTAAHLLDFRFHVLCHVTFDVNKPRKFRH